MPLQVRDFSRARNLKMIETIWKDDEVKTMRLMAEKDIIKCDECGAGERANGEKH